MELDRIISQSELWGLVVVAGDFYSTLANWEAKRGLVRQMHKECSCMR